MKNKFLVVASAALVAMMSFVPAFAADGVVEVTGGALSASAATITIAPVTLNGTNRNDIAGTTTAWTVADATGTGDGYVVTIAASNFTHTVDATKIIAVTGFEAMLPDDDIDATNGNTKPTSNMTTAKVLGAAQALATAVADTGMGTYTLLPTFTLDVPLTTYAGSYVSTVLVTVAATP